jgi:hypothetical protein
MTLKPLAGLIFTLFALPALSAPWVELNDLNLRNDIQFLADTGIISAPVTTYPLMWNAIMPDVKAINTALLSDEQLTALNNVKQRFRHASSKALNTKINIYGATSARRFTSFGLDDYDQGYVELSQEYVGTNFAGKIQTNYRAGLDHDDGINVGNDYNLDGSYLAYKVGNWILTAGALDRWWGPGVDTSLIMSTNARPLPALSITRDSSEAFETPWLSWLGTWTLTAQMAQLETDRAVPNPLMWSTRATIRPLRGLEMGVSWSFQWAGEGQPGSFNDFFKILFGGQECANGDATCDPELNTYQGNHLAGYDIRWSDTLFDTHYAIYLQTIGEDGSPNGLITDKADLFGAELRFTVFDQRIMTNLEYTDTQVSCGGREDTSQNCFYEHGTYQSGYRYYRRAIGSTYDNDAQTLALTVLSQLKSGNSWQAKFSQIKLNTNGLDRFPDDPNMGNTVSKVAEDLLQFDGQYKFLALESRFTTGITVSKSTIDNKSNNSIDGYIEWEFRF